jgi:acetylornithine deacetylase
LLACLNTLSHVEWPSSPEYGKTTFNIGTIHGGAASNIVAGRFSVKFLLTQANASAGIAIRVAGDLDQTLDVVRAAVEKHPGVIMTIDHAMGPIPLDHDVEGFETIIVSYFTVHIPFEISNAKDVAHLHGDFKRYLYGPGRYSFSNPYVAMVADGWQYLHRSWTQRIR